MPFLRKIRFNWFNADASTHVGEPGDMFFDQDDGTLRIGDGTTPGGTVAGGSALPVVTVTSADASSEANNSVGTIGDSGISWFDGGAADVLYTVTSGSTVSASGVLAIYQDAGTFAVASGLSATGANGVRFSTGNDQAPFAAIVFATNDAGTAYAAPATGTSRVLCLAAGTMIALADGTYKPIEAISYDDDLLVWDFDHRLYASAKPLWIKERRTAPDYNVLVFDDGTVLKTVGQHRIFNQQAGGFTYPLTDDTPIGTISVTEFGREITLVEKHRVIQPIDSFNVITDYHLNLFANSVLTSCSFNNVYPIRNMQFVKETRASRSFAGIPDRFVYGLRLAEQLRDGEEIEHYVARMMRSERTELINV